MCLKTASFETKQRQVQFTTELLNKFEQEELADMSQNLVHHFISEPKQSSIIWRGRTFSDPKKAKVIFSLKNIIAVVFWKTEGVVYLTKYQTIKADYYSPMLPNRVKSIF